MSLPSLLALIISALVTISDAQANMCLFGRYGTTKTALNGLYRYAGNNNNPPGNNNDLPYYKLDLTGLGCAYPNLFMWFYSGALTDTLYWYVSFGNSDGSFGLGSDGAVSGPLARCYGPSATTPDLCTEWYFTNPSTGAWELDSAVSVNSGHCPGLNCASLTVTGSGTTNAACTGTFDQVDDNAYYEDKGFGDMLWYLNYPEFVMQCTARTTPDVRCGGFTDTDDGLIISGTRQAFPALSAGESHTITDVTGLSDTGCTSSTPCTITFACSGTSTTTSFSPTTPHPTLGTPTPRPTYRPITDSPTQFPSKTPTAPTPAGQTPAPTRITPAPTAPTQSADADPSTGNGSSCSWRKVDCIWWILIICLCACCLCFCCAGIIYACRKRRQKEKQRNVEMFGDQGDQGGSYQPDHKPDQATYTED